MNEPSDWWKDKLTPVTDDREWARLWVEALAWARKEGLIPDEKPPEPPEGAS